jgi:hypothetical protein
MQLPGHVKSIGTIPIRNAETVEVPDSETMPPERFVMVALARIHKNISKLARTLDDVSRPVDEYQVNATYSVVEGVTTVEVLPQYDIYAEKITGVLVTGPASTAFTLQLGDRSFGLLTDAQGRMLLPQTGFMLSRNDRRILTSATGGNWTLELFGFADERY